MPCKEYQLANYLYAYSTLLDVMLIGNYDHEYLQSVAEKMERYSLDYFNLYTECSNRLEEDAKDAVGSMLAGSVAYMGHKLGKFIETTPVGDKTQIDEALIKGGKMIRKAQREGRRQLQATLATAKPGFMRAFISSVEELDRLHNQPVALVVGNDSVYMLPAETAVA